MTPEHESARSRTRDAAVRRARGIAAGITAAAVVLSGACSALAAHAFKGHTTRPAPAAPRASVRVPGPQTVPRIAGDRSPLQPPAAPPAAAPSEPSGPAPEVSGGS